MTQQNNPESLPLLRIGKHYGRELKLTEDGKLMLDGKYLNELGVISEMDLVLVSLTTEEERAKDEQ